jgi:predicted DNA-binding antitoxin AbrB/MazE fold protein
VTAVRAVYDGKVFIPEKPCKITEGSEVTITIKTINAGFSEKQKKLAAFRQLTREIGELNKTDPLPPKFDAILSQRVQFRELFSQTELADI